MENSKEDEERFVDVEDNVRLICNNYFVIIIGENSKESGYSFLVFLWGYINSNTFTEIIKNYAKRFEKLYNSKDFDEANKNIDEANSIIYSALKHAIQIESLATFEYIVNAMNQLLISLKFTDLMIEEILIKFDIEKTGKALDIISKGNFLLWNPDDNSK